VPRLAPPAVVVACALIAACSSEPASTRETVPSTTSTASTSVTTAPTTTTSTASTAVAPAEASTVASTVAFTTPPSTAPPPETAAWIAPFNEAAAASHTVVANDHTAAAVSLGADGWMLVNTSTGASTNVTGAENVIGVGAVDEGFVLAMRDGPGVVVSTVDAAGAVATSGVIETPIGPDAAETGRAATRASVVEHGDSVYVLVEVPTNAATSQSALAVLSGGTLTERSGTIFGALSFTDDGALVVTGGPDGRQRTISLDGGATWVALPQSPAAPHVLLSLSPDTVVGYDTVDPTHIDVYGADGAVSSVLAGTPERNGWMIVTSPRSTTADLIGVSTGVGFTIDRATGAAVTGLSPMFTLAPNQTIVDVWRTADGRHQAIASDPNCSPGCAVTPLIAIEQVPGA